MLLAVVFHNQPCNPATGAKTSDSALASIKPGFPHGIKFAQRNCLAKIYNDDDTRQSILSNLSYLISAICNYYQIADLTKRISILVVVGA